MMTELSLRPRHPRPVALSSLAANLSLDIQHDSKDVSVTGVMIDSRRVVAGDLYVGIPGQKVHGASFANDAVEAGAVAVLTDRAGAERYVPAHVPVLIHDNPREVLGALSSLVYATTSGDPQLFGVTGTNGKTSVVYVLDAILTQLGVASGFSSTAERRIGPLAVTSSLTTPEAPEVHSLLARMREENVRVASIEVSAQALDRHRVDGLIFDVVGFTNLTHEHFDDYENFDEYFSAKAKLFQPDRAKKGIVTIDSDWGCRLVERAAIPVTTLTTRSDRDAEWRVTVVRATQSFTEFRLDGPDDQTLVTRMPLIGDYMAANAGLAIVMLVRGGFALDEIAAVLERDGGIDVHIPGRVEQISGENGPLVIIDYGHTPDAFKSTLAAMRDVVDGQLIIIFGVDGDRDVTKREDMATFAAHGADRVIVTDLHPRSEDPAVIRKTLVDAARAAVPERVIDEYPSPSDALRFAISLAREGDAILYAGPGHEDYREIAGKKVHYSARDDARDALRDAGWTPGEEKSRSHGAS